MLKIWNKFLVKWVCLLGKNAKMNMNAMQANLQRNIKLSKQKERLRGVKKRQEKKFIHKKYNPNQEVV